MTWSKCNVFRDIGDIVLEQQKALDANVSGKRVEKYRKNDKRIEEQ